MVSPVSGADPGEATAAALAGAGDAGDPDGRAGRITPDAIRSGSADPSAPDPPVAPRRFVTDWAGLLFLLPVVERTGLVVRVLDGPWAAVGVRRVLHAVGQALGRRLVDRADGLASDDPALLVWCGLAPGQDPPDRDPSPLLEVETGPSLDELAEAEADALVAELRRMVGPDPLADAGESDLLVAVCARRALVVADPGWIDVHLALEDVSTVVRRAGLDLDPGYRPWLGVVVRFRYA